MQITSNDYQNSKNRKRLIIQNTKLRQQINDIQLQVTALGESNPIEQQITKNTHQPLLQQIAIQERLIKQLRAKIQAFRLERAKDNVEYIIRQEDQLKIMKSLWQKMQEEKIVMNRRKQDKNNKMLNNVPYQQYQSKFLEGLMEVVHHNRQQGSKITEVQRQIRKYHLLSKNRKVDSQKTAKTFSAQDLISLQKEVFEKIQLKKVLQKQWKPHFDQLDEQYAKLLKQLQTKKQNLNELERQERSWSTRMTVIRQPNAIRSDKKRISQVVVDPKLRQQLEDYKIFQEDKKKKKVNQEVLKYMFQSNQPQVKEKEKEKQVKEKQKKIDPIAASIAKKNQEKITQTIHDDKNISKRVEKVNNNTKKPTKTDQILITDISVPLPVAQTKKKSSINSESTTIVGEVNPESIKKQSKSTNPPETKDGKAYVKMKQASVATQIRYWKIQQKI